MHFVYLLVPLILKLQSKITNAQMIFSQQSELRETSATATTQSKTIDQMTILVLALDIRNISAKATGLSKTKIGANEKELFHISDQLLKNAIFKLSGQQTEISIDDDGDLYENYNLQPVEMILKPNGTKLNVMHEEVILNKIQAFNHDAFAKTQSINLTGNIEDRVTCSYKQKDVFPVDVIHNIDVISIGKGPSWNMKSTFGKDLSETRLVPITNASFTVHLKPNKDATAVLSATKVTALIQVNYLATLTGHVLAKFENSYIWGYENYDIETVMSAAGMPHSVMLREEITVEFYTDCNIKVYGEVDVKNGGNRCAFTVVDNEKGTGLKWKSSHAQQQKIVAANVLPDVLKPLGNSATRNLVAILLLVACLLVHTLIQHF